MLSNSILSLALFGLVSADTIYRVQHALITPAPDAKAASNGPSCDVGLSICVGSSGCCPGGQTCATTVGIPVCQAPCSGRAVCTWGHATVCCPDPGMECDYAGGIPGQCTSQLGGGSKVDPPSTTATPTAGHGAGSSSQSGGGGASQSTYNTHEGGGASATSGSGGSASNSNPAASTTAPTAATSGATGQSKSSSAASASSSAAAPASGVVGSWAASLGWIAMFWL